MTMREATAPARTAWRWIVPLAVVVLLALALRGVFLFLAPIAAGVVAIWVALSRRMPVVARVAIIAVGAVLIAVPVVLVLDFSTGYALLKVTG